jgi:hypothetical protein
LHVTERGACGRRARRLGRPGSVRHGHIGCRHRADDLVVIAYSADRGSPAGEKLSFLASWAAQHRRPNDLAGVDPATQPNVDNA